MAEDLRVTRSAISAWEGGLRQLEGPALVAIEGLYGVDRQWLLSGDGNLLCNKSVATLLSVVPCPVLESLTAWDGAGRPQIPPGAMMRPLPESEALEVLERSGGGSFRDLLFLAVPSGFPPSIPPQSQILLNTSESARKTCESLATYLVRRNPGDPHARLGTLERTPEGWTLGSPPGAAWPPQRLQAEEDSILSLVLGRVLATWSVW
jgi:hypothetical protein